jgi:hypothetical protein
MSQSTRRTVLAGAIPAVATAALAVGTLPDTAKAAEVDPVFAAIERHKAACDAHDESLGAVYDEPDNSAELCDAENEALEALLTTPPTTREGAIAFLERLSEPWRDDVHNDARTLLAWAFEAGEGSSIFDAACDLPSMIAEALRSV